MIKTRGYATQSATSPLTPFTFERREPGPHDVQIEILYCGICHTDLHQARNHWGGSIYPMVPGHELVGRVTRVGAQVTKLQVDDFAGVGCMVDSCRKCAACNEGLEQYCAEGATWSYNAKERDSGQITYGGYSERVVVEERFVVKIPSGMEIRAVAPLLCAGITTYSPLRHWKVGKHQKVGIIGLGGLGHMGVKLAKAFGAHVVMITTSPGKGQDAVRLGAHEVLISKDTAAMAKQANSFDFLLNTIPNPHDVNPYLALLKRDATMVLVGVLTGLEPTLQGSSLIIGRKTLAGSVIGGMPETQEVIDFCAANDIVSDVEIIPMHYINEAYERLLKNDVRYRFVIDMASLK
jgi:alcohol dehydrogenase (NADP+)